MFFELGDVFTHAGAKTPASLGAGFFDLLPVELGLAPFTEFQPLKLIGGRQSLARRLEVEAAFQGDVDQGALFLDQFFGVQWTKGAPGVPAATVLKMTLSPALRASSIRPFT
ncbi:MAG: hypothetical protein HC902_02535 [Calothrix sp. SM1_5_4]|nr:hypothetical protein [Calothrix sp. SM1_5_4]